ncbi:MAG TPA: polysaccharide deacetylase family protein [Bacteroidia bacterium]|nr:polysaccharide deacetylase family protein [Bacteroidia bacterium]
MKGTFIISIDFEIRWGVMDTKSLSNYGENLRGVRQAIPGMLALFEKYDFKVTFATVGMLFYGDKKSLLEHLPVRLPSYQNVGLNPYLDIENIIGEDEASDPYHYGKSLLESIIKTKQHEVGSHTFCHYYCLEKGQTIFEFEQDLAAFQRAATTLGQTPVSLVFPRNQLRYNYLKSLKKFGYTNYRGNEKSWLFKPRIKSEISLWRRSLRFLDAYFNLTGHHLSDEAEIASEFPFNIRSSRFLRPYLAIFPFLEPFKISRIKKSMDLAAETGKLYHLWWHPHNFGTNTQKNLDQLESILIHYSKLKKDYGITNHTMGSYAQHLNETYYEQPINRQGTGTETSSSAA